MVKIKDLDKATRLIMPKIVKIFLNTVSMGPRMLIRSAVSLLRANLVTRIISSASLLVLDIVDLKRGRISKPQFVRNVLMSMMLVVSGTFGWYIGAAWFVLEFLGAGVAEIIGGLIGTGIMVGVFGKVFDWVGDKFHTSDQVKMKNLIYICCSGWGSEDVEKIVKGVTASELKKVYACKGDLVYLGELRTKYASRG
jgi:hypothetical protein